MAGREKRPSAPRGLSLDELSTAVLQMDPKGVVRYANQAAEALTGLSRGSLCGLAAGLLLPEAPQWLERFGSPVGAPLESFSEVAMLSVPMSGIREKPVRALVSPGPAGSVLIELSDCEKTFLAEREEHSAGLSETNRQVLRNLAHEIKNPLGGIRGAAQLLEAELEGPELREYTSVIIGEADRLQGLVDRLLAPYRAKRTVTDVNIHEVLERVRQLLLAEFPSGLAFVRDYDVSAPDVRADREQLIQVFLNLARNAAEALEDKIREGTAEIHLSTRIAQQAQVGLRRCRLALSVHVIDNGPGIPPGIKERIFFPLVTGKPRGSGLGLSLAQSFIQQAGGTISVESCPGRTDFSVLLPLPDPCARTGAPEAKETEHHG